MTSLMIDRRTILTGAAALPLAAVPAVADAISAEQTPIAALWRERMRAAEEYAQADAALDRSYEAGRMSEFDEIDKKLWVLAYDRLWNLDDAIVAATIASLADLAIKARVIAWRHHKDADSVPQDYVERMCSDVQAFAAGNAAAGES